MTSFTFTAEQIRSAPAEVRLWLENEIAAALRALVAQAPPGHEAELAACTPEEAARIFAAIRDDFAASQVFLELGREPPVANSPPPLCALGIGEMKRRLGLGDDRLADCFRAVNQAFHEVRNDPAAALFGFDEANHLYLHETTHRSIRSLWEGLVQLRSQEMAAPPAPSAAPPFGFVPPQVGPSEDVARH